MTDLFEVPADTAAELAVVASVVWQGGKVMHDLGLAPEDFYRPAHADLWSLLLGMQSRREPIDPTSVRSRLMVECPQHSALLLDVVTENRYGSLSVTHHARTVADKAVRRRLIASAQRIIQDAQGPAPADELVEAARRSVDGVLEHVRTGDDLPTFEQALSEAMGSWEKPDNRTQSTGWIDLDRMMSGGLRPGHLCVIGARPAVGKSFCASVLAETVASRHVGALVASLEMSRPEVVARVVANVSRVNLAELTASNISDDGWARIARDLPRMADYPLWIDHQPHQTVQHITSRARSVKRHSQGLGVIVVDYLQLVRGERGVSRQEQVAGVARGLKLLARDMDCPVVALAQVNRGPEHRGSKKSTMSDLRESGEIENSADEVILLHRDDEENPGVIEFDVQKNRHGRTGVIQLAWAPHMASIRSMAKGN